MRIKKTVDLDDDDDVESDSDSGAQKFGSLYSLVVFKLLLLSSSLRV